MNQESPGFIRGECQPGIGIMSKTAKEIIEEIQQLDDLGDAAKVAAAAAAKADEIVQSDKPKK